LVDRRIACPERSALVGRKVQIELVWDEFRASASSNV